MWGRWTWKSACTKSEQLGFAKFHFYGHFDDWWGGGVVENISPLILSFILFENEHTDLKKQAIRDPYLNEDDFTDARETIVCKLIIFYNV